MRYSKELIYTEAFEAAGAEGCDEEACKEAAEAAVFEHVQAEARKVLQKLPTFGSSENFRRDFWLGGGCNMYAFTELMAADGYNTAGAWAENVAWFERYNVTREDFQFLVDASL
jgi:hypothetical protein